MFNCMLAKTLSSTYQDFVAAVVAAASAVGDKNNNRNVKKRIQLTR